MDRKKNRKRYRALAVLTTGAMVLCTGAGVRAEDSVNVLALKGPTAMGMVSLMDQADQGEITGEN